MRITGMIIRRILLICMMKMNVAGNCHRRMTSPTVIQSVGEHATTVNGNGVNPELDDILAVAQKIGLNMTMARKTALNIRDCVSEMLGEYL